MKVKVIGSGSMWTKYNSASYLIDDDIVVDYPNGMCKYLMKMNIAPTKITHVFLTHFHGDHYFDMPFFYLLKSKKDNKNITVYCSKDGKKKINQILKLAFPNSFKDIIDALNINYNFQEEITINNYNIQKVVVNHGRMKPAYGYIFSDNKINVGFTGDTCLCSNILEMAQKCNYLFCDCSLKNGTSKHMGINDIKLLSERYPECKFITSHMDDETREELLKLRVKNIIVAKDGEEFKI